MSVTCPQGHRSDSSDYCDTCGAPIDTAAATPDPAGPGEVGPAPSAAPESPLAAAGGASPGPGASTDCPHCQAPNPGGALFCEACGYDFTTGALPRTTPGAGAATPVAEGGSPSPLAPAVEVEWVAEVWVDPQWYAEQDSTEPCPSPGLPAVIPLAVRSLLIGRGSRSRNIHPEIECGEDIGISRRHAQLSTDGSRWWVEDLSSSNGTFVGEAGGPLPTAALVPGVRRELGEDDRIFLGAWTRIVVRRATDEERAGAA